MDSIDNTIEVDVPVRTAYDQWTQFESFPELMDGVQEVTQITATRTLWRTEIGGFGPGREGRGQARGSGPQDQGRPQVVQEVHRDPPPGAWRGQV
ncbi:hypothetical protein BH20ACT1_BH20ACT1_01060 [soil metagenome]